MTPPTPSPLDSSTVTRLLGAAHAGDEKAMDRVVGLVYDDLRRLARGHLARERAGHTLGATALVHESYLRLVDSGARKAVDRAHFLAIASRSMRQVLVDHARSVGAAKRGGDLRRVTLQDGSADVELDPAELLALDAALEGLEERQRRVVEYRFFGGMSGSEIARVLDVTERTVRRDWVKARAWLYATLYPDEDDGRTKS